MAGARYGDPIVIQVDPVGLLIRFGNQVYRRASRSRLRQGDDVGVVSLADTRLKVTFVFQDDHQQEAIPYTEVWDKVV